MLEVRSILVICIGNICRSPMAEAMLQARCPGLKVTSAGLSPLIGNGADPLSVAVCADHGLDLSRHIARPIHVNELMASDLVLTMSTAQTQDLTQRFPFMRGRTYRIGHWTGQDVPDPYRQPRPAFESSYDLIDAGVAAWLSRIQPLAQ